MLATALLCDSLNPDKSQGFRALGALNSFDASQMIKTG